MKKITIFLSLALLLGNVSTVHAAMTNAGTYVINSGVVWMDILNKETGVIKSRDTKFLKLVNYGTADLDGCLMTQEVQSYGILNASSTKFSKDVTIYDGASTFTSCQLENLHVSVNTNDPSFKEPEIVLKGNTVIHGSVIFSAADQGKVYKDSEVVILGKIINGTLIERK